MSMALIGGEALAWRLAWVLRGWAPEELLEGYERDRRPVAAHNIARSSSADGSERPADQEWRFDVGGRIAHAWAAPRHLDRRPRRRRAHALHRPGHEQRGRRSRRTRRARRCASTRCRSWRPGRSASSAGER